MPTITTRRKALTPSRLLQLTALTVAAIVIPLTPTLAEGLKIATVDVARIINEAPEARSKKKELDAASEDAKKKLEAKSRDLQALKTKLEEQKVNTESKEADSFRDKARDFERLRADMKADLEKRYMKVNKELSEKVMAKIESYAKQNNYDLVIDKSERFRGPVLYGKASADITDEILGEM
jgi:outer membrane protein